MHSPYVDDLVLEKVEAAQDPSRFSIYHVIGKEKPKLIHKLMVFKISLHQTATLNELIERKGFPYFYEEFQWRPYLEALATRCPPRYSNGFMVQLIQTKRTYFKYSVIIKYYKV